MFQLNLKVFLLSTSSCGVKIACTRRKSDITQPAAQSPESPQSPGSVDNPWLRSTTKTVSSGQALSFTDIMLDEIQQKETLDRVTNKPLALIQVWSVSLSLSLSLCVCVCVKSHCYGE